MNVFIGKNKVREYATVKNGIFGMSVWFVSQTLKKSGWENETNRSVSFLMINICLFQNSTLKKS